MHHPSKYFVLLACLAGAFTLTGCPELPVPLFDATGNFTGTWEDSATGDVCPITLELRQDVGTFFPLNHQIIGTLELHWGCFVPGELLDELANELPPLRIPLIGSMSLGSGDIELGLDTSLLALPFEVAVSFDGTGAPGNLMFWMDNYSGTYTFSLSAATDIPGLETINVESAGTFEVDIATGF